MKTHSLLSLGLSALALGTVLAGSATGGDAAKGSPADHARKAGKALDKHRPAAAIDEAEAAVAAAPSVAGYRVLLARSYVQGGRFQSARAAYADALSLSSDDGATALNLALMQIATGDFATARTTLADHADHIALADRGLATALAGDPTGGVTLLTQAARIPGATATVRQNLALALALAGDWTMARAAAAADLSPADVDRRMQEWASFAQPAAASDQVATLLGVNPVADSGQPVPLALSAAPPMTAAVPEGSVSEAEAVEKVVAIVPAAEPLPAPLLAPVVFGPRKEVVQPLPAAPTMLIAADRTPAKVSFAAILRQRAAAAPTAGSGDWHVQLGAFGAPGVARDAWGRMTRRFAALAGHTPQGMTFKTGGSDFYRLSIGGFDRTHAVALCTKYRARGGACFVRRSAGDAVAQWLRKPGLQVAAR
ncbi:SPOR domain-containing protein [Sphingomonas sp. Leaf343]|uniref:SPOR domain-containing protein n=1 Tax=Sphingomonas sp. Leaf343 TaxID=1736345 RepID=UPI0006F57912|nr:SPOR domain-containing protein [Sphingomonas sp. Leaf343]KQR83126.1 hypothetical protein ASG07_09125 [Sphingomonas sp. Leaf343]